MARYVTEFISAFFLVLTIGLATLRQARTGGSAPVGVLGRTRRGGRAGRTVYRMQHPNGG